MENKIEELTKAKNEQIEKLNKIKEVLKKKLDEAKNEISELKEDIGKLEGDLSSIEQKSKPADLVGNEQIMEFLKGNRNRMDFVLKRLENLISMAVKTEKNEIPKRKIVNKAAMVKGEEYSSEPEVKIEEEISTQRSEKESPKPQKSIKREPPISKKLLSIPYPTDGTIRCPKCNAIKWKEQKNRSKMISRGVYAKQYYCKTCRTEWEFEY